MTTLGSNLGFTAPFGALRPPGYFLSLARKKNNRQWKFDFSDREFYNRVQKRYRLEMISPRLSLYFLYFPRADEPVTIANIFSYLPVIHLHPLIRIPFAALVPREYRITNREHEKEYRTSNREQRISKEFLFSFPSTFFIRYSLFDIQKLLLSQRGKILAIGNRLSLSNLNFDTIASKFAGYFSSVLHTTYQLLKSSRDFITHTYAAEYEKQFRQIFRERREKEEEKEARLPIDHLNFDTIASKFTSHFSSVLHTTSQLLKSSLDFVNETYAAEYEKQFRQIFRERREKEEEKETRLSIDHLNINTIASKFTTYFSSVLHTTSQLLKSSQDFVTNTYAAELEKQFHNVFEKGIKTEREFEQTARNFSDFTLSITHLDFDTIASKFTGYFSSALHTTSQLLKSSEDFITHTYAAEYEKQFHKAFEKEIKKERGINKEREFDKTSRNLSDIELSVTHLDFDTIASKFTTYLSSFSQFASQLFWSMPESMTGIHEAQRRKPVLSVSSVAKKFFSSVLYTTSQLLKSSQDFVTHTYAAEYEKQFHKAFEKEIKTERGINKEREFDQTARNFSDFELSVTHLEFDTIASKFTGYFSSALHTTSQLLKSSEDFITHTYAEEYEKQFLKVFERGINKEREFDQTTRNLSDLTLSVTHLEFDTIVSKFTSHFSSVLHTTSQMLKSSADFITHTYAAEYEKQFHTAFEKEINKEIEFDKTIRNLSDIELSVTHLDFDTIASKFTTYFSSALHTTSQLLKSSADFITHTYAAEYEKQFHTAFEKGINKEIEFDKTIRNLSDIELSVTHLDFDIIASKFTGHFSSALHTTFQLLESSRQFITHDYIHEQEKQFRQIFQERREKEEKKETRLSINHLNFDTIASKFTSHFLSVLHTTFQLLESSRQFITHDYIHEQEKQLRQIFQERREKGEEKETRLSIDHLNIDTIASKFTNYFSSFSHLASQLLQSTSSSTVRIHDAQWRRSVFSVFSVAKKFFFSALHTTFQLLESSRQFITHDYIHEQEKRSQLVSQLLPPAPATKKIFSSALYSPFQSFESPPPSTFFVRNSLFDIQKLLLLQRKKILAIGSQSSPGIRQRPPKSEIFGQAFFPLFPFSGRTRGSPLRSPGAWYSGNKTGEGRGEPCVRPYPEFRWFLLFPDISPHSSYSPYSPTSNYRYWTERKWQQFFVNRYTNISSSTSHIKTDIFKYVSNDVEQAFTIARQEAAKRSFEKQSIKITIENESEPGTGTQNHVFELPGFEKDVMESRYTSRLLLKKHESTEYESGSDTAMPMTIRNVNFSLPAEKWLALGPGALKEDEPAPVEKIWQQAKASETSMAFPGSRTMELGASLFKDISRYPAMSFFTPGIAGPSEEAIKKLEKKIASETKKFKDTVESKVTSSRPAIPAINLNQMADSVYHLIVEKVKKERKMRGY